MTISMYQACVPPLLNMLKNLTAILEKAEANCAQRKIDPSVMASARLAPDMLPLTRQIQILTDTAKGAVARLSGVEVPSWEDREANFDDLKARIAKCADYLKSYTPDQIDGSEERAIKLKFGPVEVDFTGQSYLNFFVLPNFYFHVVTAYDILRHNGVEIGKRDYLGAA